MKAITWQQASNDRNTDRPGYTERQRERDEEEEEEEERERE